MNNSNAGCILLVALLLLLCGGCVGISLLLFIDSPESGLDSDGGGEKEQDNLDILSEKGKEFYESNKDYVEKDLAPIGDDIVHWTVLAAIHKEKITKNSQEGCKDHWLGPMKLQELHWISRRYLEENGQAQTDFSYCGDIRDDFRDGMIDVKTINDYRQDDQWINTCLREQEQKQDENQNEMYCQAYGRDQNNDQMADPTQLKDSLATFVQLITDYKTKYPSLANSLYHLYGEDPTFLRKVKNRVLTWVDLTNPSIGQITDGILGWPLSVEVQDNKKVLKRFKNDKQGITIKSKQDEPVKSLGWSYVEDVGQDESCGKFVKVSHYFSGGEKIFITYCHLKERSVEKGKHLEFDEEIGKVGTEPLHIQITQMEGDESQRVDPEIYLTPPNDVDFSELKDEDQKESEE